MNASSLTCSRERTVHDVLHAALRVADVLFASPLTRLFGVRCTSKVRPFSAHQRGPLFCFGFLGRNRAKPRLTQLRFGFVGPFVSTHAGHKVSMAISQMFCLRNALKVLQSVIGLISVNVVDLFGRIKTIHPTFGNSAVDKRFAKKQVSIGMDRRGVRAVLSENFPAARDGVKVIKGAELHAIDCKANHAVSSVVANLITPIRF